MYLFYRNIIIQKHLSISNFFKNCHAYLYAKEASHLSQQPAGLWFVLLILMHVLPKESQVFHNHRNSPPLFRLREAVPQLFTASSSSSVHEHMPKGWGKPPMLLTFRAPSQRWEHQSEDAQPKRAIIAFQQLWQTLTHTVVSRLSS